jgi:tetratricopeptide (TPR) repeat protein
MTFNGRGICACRDAVVGRLLTVLALIVGLSAGSPAARGQDVPDFQNNAERAMYLLEGASRLASGAGGDDDALNESIALAYARLGEYGKVELAMARIPQDQRAIAQCQVAEIMAKRDDVKQAKALLEEVGDRPAVLDMVILEIDYKDLAYIALMEATVRAGDIAGGTPLIKRIKSPDNVRRAQRGFLREMAAAGQMEMALGAVGRLNDPHNEAELRHDLINVCIDNGDFDQAMRIYNQMTNITVQSRARTNLMRGYVEADRLADARELATQQTSAGYRNDSLMELTSMLCQRDRLDDAQAILKLIDSRQGSWASALQVIAVAAARNDRPDLARESLDRIAQSDYDEKMGLRFYGYIECATAADDAGRHDQAVAFMDEAVALQRQLPETTDYQWARIAAGHAHIGQTQQALEVMGARLGEVERPVDFIAGLGIGRGVGVKFAERDQLPELLAILRQLPDPKAAANILVAIADKLAA